MMYQLLPFSESLKWHRDVHDQQSLDPMSLSNRCICARPHPSCKHLRQTQWMVVFLPRHWKHELANSPWEWPTEPRKPVLWMLLFHIVSNFLAITDPKSIGWGLYRIVDHLKRCILMKENVHSHQISYQHRLCTTNTHLNEGFNQPTNVETTRLQIYQETTLNMVLKRSGSNGAKVARLTCIPELTRSEQRTFKWFHKSRYQLACLHRKNVNRKTLKKSSHLPLRRFPIGSIYQSLKDKALLVKP